MQYRQLLGVALALFLTGRPAHALSAGITGYSGKQGATCAECHDGGVDPQVRFEGPAALLAGALATFRFVVESRSARQLFAGVNVAADGGVLDVPADGRAYVQGGEITHAGPQPAVAGVTAWQFTWTVPPQPGRYTLYGAGLSANGRGTNDGDAVALATRGVDVTLDPWLGDANCDDAFSAADLVAARLAADPAADSCARADADCDGTIGDGDPLAIAAVLFDPGAALCLGSLEEPNGSMDQ